METLTEQHKNCSDSPLASVPQQPKDKKAQMRLSTEMRNVIRRVLNRTDQSLSGYVSRLILQDPMVHEEWALLRAERQAARETAVAERNAV